MTTSTADLWQAVLGELEVTLSRANYKTWFKNTSLAEVGDGTAVVLVPNIFTREWIQKKYHDQIFAALLKLVDGLDQVEYRIGMVPVESSGKVELSTPDQPATTPQPTTPKPPSPRNRMLAKYTFDKFVVGGSNQLAFAAARLVSEKPGEHYNPLFLYGPAGVGKTHLMWAIRDAVMHDTPDAITVYVPSEDFVSEFTRALREGKIKQFTDRYRRVDLLLVDDLQFLAGKEKTQEEFFHTFNALHQAGKQIVLCSDRPPKAIPTLDDRLRSRFEWGMVADIAPPDLETRAAIVQSKARSQNFNLSDDQAFAIAEIITTNIRELEGGLTRVIAHCQLQKIEISRDLIIQVLGSSKKAPTKRLNPKFVIEKTADYYNVKSSDLTGSKRDRSIVLPRQVTMYIMRTELNLSFPQIAQALGGRDHTTVMHGVKKVEGQLRSNDNLGQDIRTLKESILNTE